MKKKKIVFVANRLGGGGAERVLTMLANSLNKNNDVCILYYNSYDNEYNIECRRKRIIKSETSNNLEKIIELRRSLKEENPDIVIAFEYFINIRTLISSIGLKYKIIISERNDPNKLNNRKLAKLIRDILYLKCSALVCQTPDAKDYFGNSIRKKTYVIPNPIKEDLPIWKLEESRKEVINFCRLEEQKNIPLLIDAFNMFVKEFPEYILQIYGEGHEKDNIQKYIFKLNLVNKVKINEFSSEIHNIASKARMFVLSSDYEGLSNSMLEAMSIGIPVVCTDCPIGGARMMIKDNVNGILVPCKDVYKMYTAMKSIAQNDRYAQRISTEALKLREELNLDNISNIWNDLIIRLERG